MLCWFLPYNNNINPPRFCHFSISWVSSLPFIPGATYLCRLVYCYLSLHGPTLWNQMKFLQLSRRFLAPCLCSCCSPTWNAPLPSFGYFFFKTEVRHYLIHCLPRKKWTEHLLRDTMSGPHLGNHRCSGFSWAGVLMFRMSGQQEGTLGDRGCPPPSGSFPCSSSQAEASTSLRCLRHALYYAATAANPWIEVFSPCLTSLRMDASYLSLQCLFLVVGETQYVFSEQENWGKRDKER